MKCENCSACNLSVLKIEMGDDEYVLCPRCLKILKQLEKEYEEIVDGETSMGHI